MERLKGLVIALMNDADPTRAEKAEAEIERLREVHAQVVEGLRQAREGWAKERAEVERLRAALRRLLDYTEQIEQLAYDMGEQIEIHPIVAEARAALRGEGEK